MLYISLVILMLVLFGALFLFMRTFLSRNITQATNHLNELNQDYTEKSEEARRVLQEAQKQYDEMLLKAKVDAEKLKVDIVKQAHESEELLVKQSRLQGEEIIQQANKARELIVEELDQKIEKAAIEKACELMEEVLPKEIGKEIHTRWVDETFKHGLDVLDRLKLPEDIKEAQVLSAYPLTAEQKNTLDKKIKDKIGRDIRLNEEIQPQLVAGLKVLLGSVVIDGSLQLRIKEVSRHAHNAR